VEGGGGRWRGFLGDDRQGPSSTSAPVAGINPDSRPGSAAAVIVIDGALGSMRQRGRRGRDRAGPRSAPSRSRVMKIGAASGCQRRGLQAEHRQAGEGIPLPLA